MPKIRIYIKPDQISNLIKINDRDIIHKLKNVLRLGVSEKLCVFDGCGQEYSYLIESIAKKSILIKKDKLLRKEPFPSKRIILGFPIEKEERVSFILQKATELGVSEFIPFTSQRSLQAGFQQGKQKRWKRIVIEAVRQSTRLWIPPISEIISFDEAITKNYQVKLLGSIDGGRVEDILNQDSQKVFIIVGPVGDFTLLECSKAKEQGFKAIKLATSILRVETAAVFSVGLINYYLNK